jgi:hypothetical protein
LGPLGFERLNLIAQLKVLEVLPGVKKSGGGKQAA